MEKIDPSNLPARSFKKKRKGETVHDARGTSDASFGDILETKSSSHITSKTFAPLSDTVSIESLLDDVHECGERLKEKPTLITIKEYRDSIAAFLRFVVTNSMTVESKTESGWNPLKRKKKYAIISVINTELERLAAGVIQNQYTQIQILGTVEQINGMLVDLMN